LCPSPQKEPADVEAIWAFPIGRALQVDLLRPLSRGHSFPDAILRALFSGCYTGKLTLSPPEWCMQINNNALKCVGFVFIVNIVILFGLFPGR